MMIENPIIEAHNLTVLYGRKPALWNVDFSLPRAKWQRQKHPSQIHYGSSYSNFRLYQSIRQRTG